MLLQIDSDKVVAYDQLRLHLPRGAQRADGRGHSARQQLLLGIYSSGYFLRILEEAAG